MGFYGYIGKGFLERGESSRAFQEKVFGVDNGQKGNGREMSQGR